jgi:hypothetical protein
MRARRINRGAGGYLRPVVVALVAGTLYGSWAAFAHHRLGARVAMRAGWTQVALSVTATLVLVLVLERLFRWPSNPVRGFWLAAVGTSALSCAWLVVGHALAGTPHILPAVAPSVLLGTVFNVAYARMLLGRTRKSADIGCENAGGDGVGSASGNSAQCD